jgi:hypothetical protein
LSEVWRVKDTEVGLNRIFKMRDYRKALCNQIQEALIEVAAERPDVPFPRWGVAISTWAPDNKGREIEVEVEAPTGEMAIILVLLSTDLKPGELYHTVHTHVGPPEHG